MGEKTFLNIVKHGDKYIMKKYFLKSGRCAAFFTYIKAGFSPFFVIFVFLCLSSCRENPQTVMVNSYYICGSKGEKEALKELWGLFAEKKLTGMERFALIREIADVYQRQDEYEKLTNFLSEWVLKNPDDQSNGYYLLMIAYSYIKQDSPDVAAMYFNMIVKKYPDLIVKGSSIHLECLKQLIVLVDTPKEKIWCYEELISRFQGSIDLGTTWFMLGKTYEQAGEWEKAIGAYAKFIPFYGAIIPGYPGAYDYAKQMVDFNNSSKNWTFENLPALMNTIKSALEEGNAYRLWQYRAKVNFFSRSWAQTDAEDSGTAEFNLPSFGNSSRISYAADLSPGSNANEAYLRTWGWNQFTPIWYFYFRKVNFPPDPEIHGRWEWAGVYYGERF